MYYVTHTSRFRGYYISMDDLGEGEIEREREREIERAREQVSAVSQKQEHLPRDLSFMRAHALSLICV